MSKKCPGCMQTLDESEFNWKIKNIKLQSYCKKCSRLYIKSHYDKNRQYYIVKAHKRNDVLQKRARDFLGPYLLSHPCVDCGETNILVLEFDHKNRKEKTDTIGRIIQSGASLDKIKNEVAKCDVRCSNCHRKKTEIENNSWKLKYAPVA